MKWIDCSDINELKFLSAKYEKNPFKNMKIEINNDLAIMGKQCGINKSVAKNIFNINSRDWNGLLKKIMLLKEFSLKIQKNMECSYNEKDIDNYKTTIDSELDYFKSQEDEIIFYLLEMEGHKRSEKLGITRKCFINKSDAKKWRQQVIKKIHPDKSKNKNASRACAKINQLYEEMINNE